MQNERLSEKKAISRLEDAKHFDIWMPLKERIHSIGRKWKFREGEIWWMAIGENVGTEINGKGDNFLRPILVVRKYGPGGFFGVPLSSQKHEGMWYANFLLKNREQCALLSQASSFCSYRLYGFIGRLSKSVFEQIVDDLEKLLFKR